MDKNRLLIAAAGAGKTTTIVREALLKHGGVLIVTFTEVNRDEIIQKFIEEKGYIPTNVTILTWFSFLIQHGVKPYQGCYHPSFVDTKFSGLILCTSGKEGKRPIRIKGGENWVYIKSEEEPLQHYSSKDGRLYSDRLPKLVTRIGKNSHNRLYQRISALFPYIYVDEVQDLCGYDLDILKALFATNSEITLVGDPRQYVFSTHRELKHSKYSNGRIRDFIVDHCSKGENQCSIDDLSLNFSHRNSLDICYLSSLLYKGDYPEVQPCSCLECQSLRMNGEIKAISYTEAAKILLKEPQIVQLRYDKRTSILSSQHRTINMGLSKGLTFDSVMIYPTKEMKAWLKDRFSSLKAITKAKLYIAITRARKDVYFVFKNNEELPELPHLPISTP